MGERECERLQESIKQAACYLEIMPSLLLLARARRGGCVERGLRIYSRCV